MRTYPLLPPIAALLVLFSSCASKPSVAEAQELILRQRQEAVAAQYDGMLAGAAQQYEALKARGNDAAAEDYRETLIGNIVTQHVNLTRAGNLAAAKAFRDAMVKTKLISAKDLDARIENWTPPLSLSEQIAAKQAERDAEREARRQAGREAGDQAKALRVKRMEDALARIDFDSENQLAYLEFDASKHLFREGDVDFFVGQASPDTRQGLPGATHFVAVHEVDDDEPLLDIENDVYVADGSLDSYQYSAAVNAAYVKIAQRLLEAAPLSCYEDVNCEIVTIDHFTRSPELFNAVEMTRLSHAGRIKPLMSMSFRREKTGADRNWRPELSRTQSGVMTAARTQGGANSLEKALALRVRIDADKDEQMRWVGLSDEEKQAEIASQWAEIDSRMAAEAREKGLVYRDQAYWEQYNVSVALRQILNGSLKLTGYGGKFPHLYGAFFSIYYRNCPGNIPPGSPGYDITEVTVIAEGGIETEIKGPVRKFRVKAKYWPLFEHYSETVTLPGFENFFEGLKTIRDPARAAYLTEFITNISEDMDTMFRLESCDSGFLRQFEENLHRIGNGLPTLQEEDGVHPFHSADR